MRKNTKICMVTALAAISTACLAGAISKPQNISSIADVSEFYVRGAAVRLLTDNTVESGIRFSVVMSNQKYAEMVVVKIW